MLSRVFGFGRRPFDSLSEQEILALAISSEEDDGRIYRAYADGLREQFPQSAKLFDDMAEEEDRHRSRLIERHKARFGERIPLIRREHVRGYYERATGWSGRSASTRCARRRKDGTDATASTSRLEETSTRKLLGDCRARHPAGSSELRRGRAKRSERRQFILTYVQPGLAGLMDGSVSTLAPLPGIRAGTWNVVSASVGPALMLHRTPTRRRSVNGPASI